MRTMLIVVVALALFVPVGSFANSIGCDIATAGNSTTYTYTLTSTEDFDYLTSLHVYTPMPIQLVTGGSCQGSWGFGTGIDDETGCTDIFWCSADPDNDALGPGESITCTLIVPNTTWTKRDFMLPGCLGNWGYESYFFQELGVWVDMPSVAVPMGVAPTQTPEPTSLSFLLLGACILGRRIKRA